MNAGALPIPLLRLRTLWIHTGTACNLSCPFCHEGSKPGDTRLEAPVLAELLPLFDQALELGVERFAFTGGEPLILRDIHLILGEALARRPVLVLTNGTAPFIRRSHQLQALRARPHGLSVRVSIDHPDEATHDAGRGLKNFRKAMEGLRLLHAAGFDVGITRQSAPGEDGPAITARFRQILRRAGLPIDLPVATLPELGLPVAPGAPATSQPSAASATSPPCATGRMMLKRAGALQLTACPMVDDDSRFDLPPDLREAAKRPTPPVHRRCQTCLACSIDYGGIDAWRRDIPVPDAL